MADKNQIKNTIVLEGEAEYKKQLGEINRSLRESKSAMKAAAAEYEGAEDSMLALYKQGDALERVIRDQEDALRLMENQLRKVEEAYGKNSREATELRTKINNMRTELAKSHTQLRQFEARLEETEQAMQGAGSEAKQAGEAIGKLGDDAKAANAEVGSLADELEKLTGFDIGGLTLAAGVAAAGAGIVEGLTIGNETLESWNQIAAYTGLTGDALERVKEDAQAVYQSGVGESLADVAQATASIYQLTGYTGTSLQDCVTYALALSDTFGMDVSESARAAAVLMEEFGIDGKTAYDLITTGAQNGADKNGNLLDTINEYAPYFANSGQSAEEFFNALITGAQNGIYDVDKIGDAWKEFTIRLTDGSDGTKEALEKLGFVSEDITKKFAAGGPAADKAAEDIIAALAKVEDPMERNLLGVQLFGTQWEDTGGKILPVFENMGSELDDVAGAAQRLADVKYSDLDTAWNNLARSVEALAQPVLVEGAQKLAGVLDTMASAVDQIAAGDWKGAAQTLFGPTDEMTAEAEAARSASEELRGELAALDEQINAAFAAGDNVTGWTLTAQREKLLAEIVQIETEAVAAMTTAGEGTAQALEDTASEMETAAQTVGKEAVTALEDAQPDMMDAGEGMGESAELGLKAGSSGMEDAGSDAADGAVAGMKSGVSAAYNAGYATGQAYERGYRAALDTHSPSRVMQRAARDTTDGALLQFKADKQRLYEAAAGLGAAVEAGYAGYSSAADAHMSGGHAALDYGAMAEAVKGALVGLAMVVDGERTGELVELGVSRATQQRSIATVRGQSAMSKRW